MNFKKACFLQDKTNNHNLPQTSWRDCAQTHFVLFAFLEDVVLGHAHSLHDQFNSFQLDEAVLSQIALR